jgi:TctA family transporter
LGTQNEDGCGVTPQAAMTRVPAGWRQSMLMSRGSLKISVDNALVTTLVDMGFALLLVPPLLRVIGVWRRKG